MITDELATRPCASPDLAVENELLHRLLLHLGSDSADLFQLLLGAAQDLCGAGTVGVSLLENTPDGEIFRWEALSGRLSPFQGYTVPRHFSPCGICLDRGTPQLYDRPGRYFDYLEPAEIVEGLIIPFMAGGVQLGTLWVVSHDEGPRFDRQDVRLLSSLASVTASIVVRTMKAQALAEAEASLKRSEEERLRFEAMILAHVRDSVVVTDLDGRIIEWNRGAEEIFGYTAAEMLGRTPAILYPDLGPQALSEDRARIRDGKDFTGEWLGQKKNGERVWVDLRTTLMRDTQGQVIGLLGLGKDVTLRREAERAADAERCAAEENKRKDEFLAMVGHELRNPLAPILTALQVMQMRGEVKAQEECAIIERQVRHLMRLVDDLLDVSRMTRGQVVLKRQVLDLREVIETAVETTLPLIERKNHRLALDIPAEHPLRVEVDPVRMAQVFGNLLTNAAKYTEPGGRIEVSATAEAGEVEVAVRDNGIGLAPELIPTLFDLFVQGFQASDRREGGLGIGLSIARNLVELHGGKISVHSAGPGLGSTFRVRLPRVQGAARETARKPSSERLEARAMSGHTRRRVLLVDDNRDLVELLAMGLRDLGHDVRVALDAPSALVLAERERFEVAVLDIGLPVMDGVELGRRLRARPELAGLRLIALTGYGQESDRQRTRAAGFDLHLLKPVDLETIHDAVGCANFAPGGDTAAAVDTLRRPD